MHRHPISPNSCGDLNPIQRLRDMASDSCGVSWAEATSIDSVNLGEEIGEYLLSKFSERFYDKVLADPDEWFRGMFKSEFNELCENQYDFLIQRFGGPSYYSDRKGHMKLLCAHSDIEISPRSTERWLQYIRETINEMIDCEEIKEERRGMLEDYFRHTAYFLLAASEEAKKIAVMGTGDDDSDHVYALGAEEAFMAAFDAVHEKNSHSK